MNIYIHFYIYFIYNTRLARNNFMIVYYCGTKYRRGQNRSTGSTAYVCRPVAEPVAEPNVSLLDIYQPIDTRQYVFLRCYYFSNLLYLLIHGN